MRDVFSPDSADSGIMSDRGRRICRRRVQASDESGHCEVITGDVSTPEKVDESGYDKSNRDITVRHLRNTITLTPYYSLTE